MSNSVCRLFQVMYAVALLLEYLRTMQMFYMSKMLGPKIIMIQRMVRQERSGPPSRALVKHHRGGVHLQLKDVAFFLCILAIFILSFGIAMQVRLTDM